MTIDHDREALAEFCAGLRRLRGMLRGPASARHRALVEQAVLAARRGDPPGEILARLGLNGAPEEDDPGPSRTALPPPIDAGLSRVTGMYVCPRGTCTRVAYRPAGADLPNCDIHDQALRFIADQ